MFLSETTRQPLVTTSIPHAKNFSEITPKGVFRNESLCDNVLYIRYPFLTPRCNLLMPPPHPCPVPNAPVSAQYKHTSNPYDILPELF